MAVAANQEELEKRNDKLEIFHAHISRNGKLISSIKAAIISSKESLFRLFRTASNNGCIAVTL